MAYRPKERTGAKEALVGRYLNPRCEAEAPELPRAMPWSISSHISRWRKERDDELCHIDDLFTEVVAVELERPLGVVLREKKGTSGGDDDDGGVDVVEVVENSAAAKSLMVGDSLLSLGHIDVENASLDHIHELLEQWPADKVVPMLFLR